MRISTLTTCLACALTLGCGGNIGNPSDAALMQTAREIRDGLKLPPEDRPVETLNLTRAIQIAAQGQTLDSTERMGPMAETRDPVQDAVEANELAAVALAQDARLAIIAGNDDQARPMLEESLATYPTLDALDAIAPLLADESEFEALDAHCAATWDAAADSTARSRVLEVCIAYGDGATVDEIIPWAPAEVRETIATPIAQPVGE